MRTCSRSRLALFLVIPTLLALSSEAPAAHCKRTCHRAVKQCTATALPTMIDCKDQCFSTALKRELGACISGCTEVVATTRGTCRSGVASCVDVCRNGIVGGDPTTTTTSTTAESSHIPGPPSDHPPSTNSASCFGQCGQTLGGCAHDVAAGGNSCIKGCASADDRHGCITACTATARDTAMFCKADARDCREGCGGPTESTTTTLGAPNTTLLPPTTTIPEATTTLPEPPTTTLMATTTTLTPTTTLLGTTTTTPTSTTTLMDTTTTTTVF